MSVNPRSAAAAPLAGHTVVELGQNIAGPMAGQILADLGCDVIKFEKRSGDDARRWGPAHPAGASWIFQIYNRNKSSEVVELGEEAGRARILERIRDADIFIQNLRPGTCERLGLGPEALHAINPRLVYCSIWAFGKRGPMRSLPGYDPVVAAHSGLMHLNSGEDGTPRFVGLPLLDKGSALWLVIGALAGIVQRERSGRGCVVDTSLLETGLAWLDTKIALLEATGRAPDRATASDTVAPFESFHTPTGPVVLGAGNDAQFRTLALALDRREWLDDARFATNAARLSHRPALAAEIQSVLLACTREEWADRFRGKDLLFSPAMTVAEAVADAQARALGQLAGGDAAGLVGLPLSFDDRRPSIARLAPDVGAGCGPLVRDDAQ